MNLYEIDKEKIIATIKIMIICVVMNSFSINI